MSTISLGGNSTPGTTTTNPVFTGNFGDLLGPVVTGGLGAFNQPFPTFTSDQVIAPFNQDQTGAFGNIRAIAGSPTYAQALGNAGTMTLNAAVTPGSFSGAIDALGRPVGYQSIRAPNFTPQAASYYSTPYTNDVVNTSLAGFDQNAAREDAQNRARLAGEGAFGAGGSESEALLAGQHDLARGNLEANLRNAAFTNAQTQFNADTNRGLTAATSNQNAGLAAQGLTGQNLARLTAAVPTEQQTQLAGSAQYGAQVQQLMNLGLTQAQALLIAGNQQQEQAQKPLTFQYQQKLAQNKYPWDQTNALASILFGSPQGKSVTTPSPSTLSQVGGGILTGLGLLSNTPKIIGGAKSLGDLLGFGGGSSSAAGLGAGGSSIVPNLSVAPDTSIGSTLGNLGVPGEYYATGGRVGQVLYSNGGERAGAFGHGYRSGGRIKGAFADGGDVPDDASISPDMSGMPSIDNAPGPTEEGFKPNFLTLLGASMMSGSSPFAAQNIGRAVMEATEAQSKLGQQAAQTKLAENQADLFAVQGKQKNLLLNFARGNNGVTATADGLLIDPRRVKAAIDMFAAAGDGRSAGVYRQLLDMGTKGNFDAKTGNYLVPNSVLQGTAQRSGAEKGVAPGMDQTPPVTSAPNAPKAIAAFAGEKANAEVPAKVAVAQAEGQEKRDTQAAENKTVPPNSTVIPGGVGSGRRPIVGQGSAFSPSQPQAAQAPAAPGVGVRMTTPPITYTEDDQKSLAKEMNETQTAAVNAPAAIKQIQDIGKEAVNSGPGTITMSEVTTALNKFGIDINKVLPEGWQNDPNKVGIVETNLQELAMSLAKASQSGARFTNADLMAAMQSKPNLMLSPGARAAILGNLEQRERFALDKAQFYRDFAKQNGGQLKWDVLDAWRDKVTGNDNYPEDLRRTYRGLSDVNTPPSNVPPATSVPKNAISVIMGPDKKPAGYKLSDGTRVKADGSPW